MSVTLRQLAASTAVAMAFSPLANAAGLITDNVALVTYRPALSEALAKATGDNAARGRAGGFMVELENVLQGKPVGERAGLLGREGDTRVLAYPNTRDTGALVVYAVVPPSGSEAILPAAGICAQQYNRPVAAWMLTQKGELPSFPVVQNPEGSTAAACQSTLRAMNAQFKQLTASDAPTAPPAPATAPKVATAAVVPTNN